MTDSPDTNGPLPSLSLAFLGTTLALLIAFGTRQVGFFAMVVWFGVALAATARIWSSDSQWRRRDRGVSSATGWGLTLMWLTLWMSRSTEPSKYDMPGGPKFVYDTAGFPWRGIERTRDEGIYNNAIAGPLPEQLLEWSDDLAAIVCNTAVWFLVALVLQRWMTFAKSRVGGGIAGIAAMFSTAFGIAYLIGSKAT